MSRTIGHGTGHKWNGSKGGGYEYWSKRPGPIDPCKKSKIFTHKIERARKNQLIVKIKKGLISE